MEYQEIKLQILNKIKENDNIIIVRHIKPDGDCLGSSLGLREILRASFPNKKIHSIGVGKASYVEFIGKEDEVVEVDYKNSLIIVVDTATFDRIDNPNITRDLDLIKIDHHVNVEDYGKLNYVRTDLPAVCAIITDFYETFKDELVLNKQAALALYTGMVTDTGRFRYSGTNSLVLRLASILLEHDLEIEDIYARLYLRDKESLKLQGHVFNNFKATKNQVAYFFMTEAVQKRFGVNFDEAAVLISSLDGIKDHLIWVLFIEENGLFRVRIRSRFVAINEVAAKFNGGGHKQASGATVHSRAEARKLLKTLDKVLEEFKKNNKEKF